MESLGHKSDSLKQLVVSFNENNGGMLRSPPPIANPGPAPGRAVVKVEPLRTQSRPVFILPEAPPNLSRSLEVRAQMPLLEFQNQKECLCLPQSTGR